MKFAHGFIFEWDTRCNFNMIPVVTGVFQNPTRKCAKHGLATATAYWMAINFDIVHGTQLNNKKNTVTVK